MAMQDGHWRSPRRPKIINDALHGTISIGGRCLQIMDTPQFQRLRFIHQLQACHYVYPTAHHTRFEHCLGVHHLAGLVLAKLQAKQPELAIDAADVELVQMAGLCHDIGHGAFGHMLDYDILPRVVEGKFDWVHEQRSCEILERLVDENHIDLGKAEMDTVKSLIHPHKFKRACPDEKRFLWDIVANESNGIDVDKFDYLARDSWSCGIKISFDHARVIELMRVVGGNICFNSRGVESVYDLFHARSKMYKQAYFHKASRAIEQMISDALFAANHKLKLQEYVHNVDKFCKLDDTILREICRSDDPSLEESRTLIRRIETRQLYKFVDEFIVPLDHLEDFKKVTVDDVYRYKKPGSPLRAEQLIVHNLKIDYGQENHNPVDEVHFYDDREDPLVPRHIAAERVSNLIPQNYKDVTVRLYLKELNTFLEDEARETFVAFQKARLGREVMRTPSLKRRASEMGVEGGDEDEDDNVRCSQSEATSRRLRLGPPAAEEHGMSD